MPMKSKVLLNAGGMASLLAALLHLAVIAGGPDWYRFFGAGEEMAKMAEQNSWYPALLTLMISSLLAAAAMYAFSGAGLIARLPWQRPVLCVITGVYLFRAVYGVLFLLIAGHFPLLQQVTERPVFMLVSSLICLAVGLSYFLGVRSHWHRLS
ncbi:hypothetical protein LY04_00742 [Oceanimonas baumannii]|uniref:DUF2214 domain-containing protein n=3 Tax=Oceanimonas baumannii TaxID=129578 RepID=A0ABY2F1K5_9GAMM|nr:hypothetical protein LY04_00742 [Oceanimonas baumannii]